MTAICVVTVCRNALADLRLTIASVSAQSHPNLLHIVQDGRSTDGTQAFLEGIAAAGLQWRSEPDEGIYDAMNKAMRRCPDDSWVIFLNAGDRFASDTILDRLEPLLDRSADFVFGAVRIRDGAGGSRVYGVRRGARLEMPGCHQSMLVRAALLKQHPFDTRYRVGADFEFFLRTSRQERGIAFTDEPIAEIAPEGFSAANEPLLRRDYAQAIAAHRGELQSAWWLLKRRLRGWVLKVLGRGRPTPSA